MPWREPTAMGERKEFIDDLLDRRYSMSELCGKYGISRKTRHRHPTWGAAKLMYEVNRNGSSAIGRFHERLLRIEDSMSKLKRRV